MADIPRSIQIPADFVQTQTEVNGTVGIAWLHRLPAIIADCERRWSLTVGPPFLPLSYNYVAPAIRADGAPAVLKAGPPVVLHGDLHHDNILAAQRQPWLVIDPKGLLGEAEYETACGVQNTLPTGATPAEATRIAERCIDQLAEELGFDRARIRAWVVAQAVLGAFWTLEDHGHGWEPALADAEILAAIK